MPDEVWRCIHPDGDVKMAALPDHKEKLEARGYVCEVFPDQDWHKLPNPDGVISEGEE